MEKYSRNNQLRVGLHKNIKNMKAWRYQIYRPCRCQGSAPNGFTLVEVLVALAVLTIALAAVMRTLSQSIDTSGSLRDRTIALWVAQNQLATHQIQHDWPELRTSEGTTEMVGREWRWREQVTATNGEPDLRQIEIEVRAASGPQPLARLLGFLSKS